MSSIKPCTSAEQVGCLQLRMALWPADPDEHLPEMQELCAQAGRYAQFIAYSGLGEPQGPVEVALRSDYVNGSDSSPVGLLEGLYDALLDNTASHAMHEALGFEETERVVCFRKSL